MSDSTALTKAVAWPTKTKKYVGELRDEMKLVTWPSWKQVRSTTGVVIVAVFAFAAYFAVVDFAVGTAIERFFAALTQ
jgi:preprotein translocase subunit SecE